MAAINIEEVCSPADIPTMVSVANITGVDLTAEEGFLLSRIDGRTPVTGVLQLSSFDSTRTLELLASLYSKGLINFTRKDGQTWAEFRESQKGKTPKKPAAKTNGAGASSDLEELILEEIVEEVPDLSEKQCRQILKLHRQVTEATNPYEVLGVPRNVNNATLKKKHREVAMNWHPDRFFRKEIGKYREMIKTIFAVTHEAYEVLTDEEQRKQLDNELKLEEYRKQREDDKKKSGERSERVAKRDKGKESIWARKLKEGLKDRILKAKRHFDKAKADFENKRYASASSNIQLAMTYDPWNEEYPKYWEEIKPEVDEAVYKESMRRGANHEAMVDYSFAEAEYRRAVAAKPDDPDANFRLGRVLLKLESDLRTAKDLLQKASLERPDDIEVLLALGTAYKKMKMFKNALRTFEKIKSLDRKNPDAMREIKELKKKV